MSLEDLLEARLAGEQAEAPEALADDLKHALAAHEALQYALGETLLLPAAQADDRAPPELPTDYEIVRELGRGGMGVVYLARQKSLDRLVAVKVLRPGEIAFGPMVRRFLDEAKHLARLRHPNLVGVYEVGEAGGEPYFSMDYIEGESLADLLRRERLSPSRALAILKQAAEGVAHAHQAGIIHRDLKPANILIDAAGRAYVTDFGLARNLTDESDRTHSGAVMGTPQYMAPEQARGETRLVGEATDVHALGAVLYEMLTGRPPYGSDNPLQILVRLVHEEPAPPRRIDPRIGRDLETICLKALAKQPAARYATVRALLEDIHRYETGQPLMARRPGIAHHIKRLARRYGKLVTAAVVAAILTAAAVLAVAPKLFDKSVDELVAWGESEQQAGRQTEALNIYCRALLKAAPAERRELLDRMVRCVREIDDSREAVERALELLDLSAAYLSMPTAHGDAVDTAPDLLDEVSDASFGRYDVLVAEALLTRLSGRHPNWVGTYSIENGARTPQVPPEARPLMQLVEKRLAIALQGPSGTPDERSECERLVNLVRKQLAGLPEPDAASAEQARKVAAVNHPLTEPRELLQIAADESQSAPVRLLAAFHAGEKLEQSDDKSAALDAYAKAYSLRSKFPIYAVQARPEHKTASTQPPPLSKSGDESLPKILVVAGITAEQVTMALRDAYAACQRLGLETVRAAPDDLRGGLGLRFEGSELLGELKVTVGVALSTQRDDIVAPLVFVPVSTTPTWIGVADGRYRLNCGFQSGEYRSGRKDLAALNDALVLDTSALPAEVEVRGQTIDLPPIRVRLLAVITTLTPAEGAALDLQEAVFRWTPIPNAARYMIGFERETSTSLIGLGGVETKSTNLCLGLTSQNDLNNLPRELIRGRTGVWRVRAYNASNVEIARTYGTGKRFLVARGLAKSGD